MRIINILFTAVLFLLTLPAYKKGDSPPPEQPLIEDGPMTAQLGKRINLGSHGFSRETPFWGKNSDELFITASTEILRVDIAAKKLEVVENTGGLITGKTHENSGVIFLGKINNEFGYHVYNFSSNTTEKIISVSSNEGTLINIAGNNIFYYSTPGSPPSSPCNGFCWPIPGPAVPGTFYHLDKQTKQITDLKNKQFRLFSTDGSQAILSSMLESRMYVFDNNSKTIIDSSDLNFTSEFGLFYHDNVLKSFERDVLGNITIKNYPTGQVFRQYPSNFIVLSPFRVSADGTKLYYGGGILNGNSMNIIIYDIEANTEEVIADIPFGLGGTQQVGYFVLSDDNKKMAVQYLNDLYLKVLD